MTLATYRLAHAALWILGLLAIFPNHSFAWESPVLAGPIGKDCLTGAKYSGQPRGTIETISGVQTYVTKPRPQGPGPKKVMLFFSDVFGPFFENNFILQDHFASEGFHVLGLDYFFGDYITNHTEPDFDVPAWIAKSRKQAEESVPGWVAAVRARFGGNTKFFGAGYCFGAPYALEAAATNNVSAAAFAHPADLTDNHFLNLQKPVLLSCAESDMTFPLASRRRAVDLLMQNNATYHLQVFGRTVHGFATRADPADLDAVYAKEESARSVVGWFNRFA